MKASDLTYEVQQNLLANIREQVGSTEYHRMIDALGEDGLINLALEKANEIAAGQSPPKKKGFWAGVGWVVRALFTCLLIAGLLGTEIGRGYLLLILMVIVIEAVASYFRNLRL